MPRPPAPPPPPPGPPMSLLFLKQVLHGILNAIVYIDDISVAEASEKDHLETLEIALS